MKDPPPPKASASAAASADKSARQEQPYVSLADITEIELLMLKRMREVTIGEHRSASHGSGFDFQGMRDWQPGDPPSAVDWPQSTITNFSPLVVREFEQPSTATVAAVADVSLSTRCGSSNTPIAALVARAIATIGMSAVFFQDPFGLVTFDHDFTHLAAIRPRTGKTWVTHCLEAYQFGRGLQPVKRAGDLSTTLASYFRSTTLLPVISDFLFEARDNVLRELALLNHTHDVFLVLIDSDYAFETPGLSAGWIDVVDVETGRSRTLGRGAWRQLARRVREWQDGVESAARDLGLDVVRIGLDPVQSDIALGEFVAARRLRKTRA